VDAIGRARAHLEQQANEVSGAERKRLDGGEASIDDLVRGAAFDEGLRMDRARHDMARQRAEEKLREAAQVEREARRQADRDRRNVEVVERHRAEWKRQQVVDTEAREQEAADEMWRGRHRKP
jgi:hypothetical protein